MENSVSFPTDYVGRVVLVKEGCFRKELFYFSGYRHDLIGYGAVRFFDGITGPETEISVCEIAPCGILIIARAEEASIAIAA
jgi:hypothetical protein